MATNPLSTGLDHPTVVPENFDPPSDEDEDEGEGECEGEDDERAED